MNRITARILLTHKIAAIGATGVLGIVIVGAIYLFGANVQDRYRRDADHSQAVLALASNLGINLLESRRAEKDFLLRNDPKYVERHAGLEKTITQQIDALRQQLGSGSDLAKQIDTIGAGYKRYAGHFTAMVDGKRRLGLNENLGLEGALRKSVHAIETKLNDFDRPLLLSTMLMMRRHEKDFMLRRDAKYGEDMKKRASEFTALLDRTNIAPADVDDLKQKLAAYQTDFFAWMNLALVVAKEQAATSDAYSAIEPAIDAMFAATKDSYARADAANQESRTSTNSQMLIAILLIAIGVCVFAFWIGRSVARPIRSMTEAMGKLAEGKHDIAVAGTERTDEIGSMARATLVFRDGAIERVRLEHEAAEQRQRAEDERRRNEEARAAAAREVQTVVSLLGSGLERLAKGDLTVRLDKGFTADYLKTKDDFNLAITRLQETIGTIVQVTREVSDAAQESAASTTDLSQRTEEQAASLEETSASMEEISVTVRKNAESAQQANELAAGTQKMADQGGAVVAQAVEAMSRIEQSSGKMSDIISVIDEIARQTNLLALNAAVEAARAGEAGRGFAVVASEVRSLAQRSSQAAKDIKDLIANSASQVRDGVDLVSRAGASLTDIMQSIKKVAAIVSDIALASGEQTTGIEQVTTALTSMDEITQRNSALVEENAATAKTLESQSRAMREQVSFFRIAGEPESAPRMARHAANGSHPRQARVAVA